MTTEKQDGGGTVQPVKPQQRQGRAKGQQDGQGPVANRELVQRMNFLHQAAILLAGAAVPVSTTSRMIKQEKARKADLKGKAVDLKGKGTAKEAKVRDPALAKKTKRRQRIGNAKSSNDGTKRTSKSRKSLFTDSDSSDDTAYTDPRNKPVKKGKVKTSTDRAAPVASTSASASARSKPILSSSATSLPAASTSSSKTAQPPPSQSAPDPSTSNFRRPDLSTHYVQDLRAIARKSVLRVDPSLKRTLCRVCHTVLIPGLTSHVRVKPSGVHVHDVRTKCLTCGTSRWIPAPPLHHPDEWPLTIPQSTAPADRKDNDVLPTDAAGATTESGVGMSVDEQEHANGTHAPEPKMQEEERVSTSTSQSGSTPTITEGDAHVDSEMVQPKTSIRKAKKRRDKGEIVPGTAGQYRKIGFHEGGNHRVYRGNERLQ